MLDGTKPLREAMITYCQWGSVACMNMRAISQEVVKNSITRNYTIALLKLSQGTDEWNQHMFLTKSLHHRIPVSRLTGCVFSGWLKLFSFVFTPCGSIAVIVHNYAQVKILRHYFWRRVYVLTSLVVFDDLSTKLISRLRSLNLRGWFASLEIFLIWLTCKVVSSDHSYIWQQSNINW